MFLIELFSFFGIFYFLFALFLKENWVGKSALFVNADKQYKRDAKIKLK